MDNLFKTFKRRLMLLCMLVLLAVIAAIHVTVYVTSNNLVKDRLESNAKGIAVSIANGLMWNVEEYKLFLETRDVNSEYYKKMQAFFANVKANSNAKYIYTEHKINAETVEYIIDAEPIGSEDYSPPGATDENDPQSEEVYSSGIPAGFRVTKYPKWGKLLGANAPIFDQNGEILGLVGVDIDGSRIYSYLNGLHVTLLIIYAFILALSWLSLSKYSHAILDPLLKDKLTGAYTKRYFEKMLQEEIGRSVRLSNHLALMMLDLDYFKKINDTYGHVFGDKVLLSISEIVKKSLRPSDYFIRYGGEEFAVMITNVSKEQTLDVAERIRKTVENTPVFNKANNIPVKITVSIGVAIFDKVAVNAKDLIENADSALYKAKIERNMVSVF